MRNKNSKSNEIYTLTSAMMNAFMTDRNLLGAEGECRFEDALRHSCNWMLTADKPGEVHRLIKAMNILIKGGLREFSIYHRDFCPYVDAMLRKAIPRLEKKVTENEEAFAIVEHFRHRRVFVYGTLMRGQSNHESFLKDEWYAGAGIVCGFDMYDMGSYPGIVKGSGDVTGELYEVPASAIESLDQLEGEGSLYLRECLPVIREDGSISFAEAYIYNRDIDGLDLIPEIAQPYTSDWRDAMKDYVWYVSYGSNMLNERFTHYIKGGSFEGGGACHRACADTDEPRAVRPYDIPFDMYFGNRSGSWEGRGVSFLDVSRPGHAKGVAYLITREQFEHVAKEENGGTAPEDSVGWYNKVVNLGRMSGYDVVTITNGQGVHPNEPSEAYLSVLARGLSENYPEMTNEDIQLYLDKCRGCE